MYSRTQKRMPRPYPTRRSAKWVNNLTVERRKSVYGALCRRDKIQIESGTVLRRIKINQIGNWEAIKSRNEICEKGAGLSYLNSKERERHFYAQPNDVSVSFGIMGENKIY
jgi:hypothetical protein